MRMSDKFQVEDVVLMMKKINIDLELYLEKEMSTHQMSGTQVYFLVYILRYHPEGSYISEMCREIGVSKATLSVLVKKLREKGYLYFRQNPEDIRKKKVLPTEKLIKEGTEFIGMAQKMEDAICQLLDEKERQSFWEMENKILFGLNVTKKDRRRRYENSFGTTEAV